MLQTGLQVSRLHIRFQGFKTWRSDWTAERRGLRCVFRSTKLYI